MVCNQLTVIGLLLGHKETIFADELLHIKALFCWKYFFIKFDSLSFFGIFGFFSLLGLSLFVHPQISGGILLIVHFIYFVLGPVKVYTLLIGILYYF